MSKKKTKFYHCIPVLMMVCMLPFVIHLHLYKEDMEEYSWYGMEEECTDFFSYGKAVLFCAIVSYMLIKLIWEMLQGRLKIRKNKYVYLLAGIASCFVISTLCAKKIPLALWGGYQRFEGFFVLSGYLITCIYSYYFIKDTESRNMILNGLAITTGFLCIIGFFQIAGRDPLLFQWVQKWILPASLRDVVVESRVRKNTVYLTLANANNASVYLAGLLPVFLAYAGVSKGRKKIGLCVLSASMFVCLIFTYSRVGIVMLVIVTLFAAWLYYSIWRKKWKKYIAYMIAVVVAFILLDGITGFRFRQRISLTVQSFIKQRKNCDLEELRTERDGIYFSLHGISVKMYAKNGLENEDTLQFYLEDGRDISDDYNKETGKMLYPGLEKVSVFVDEVEEEPMLFFCVGETVFRFAMDQEQGYLLYVGNGKYDKIQPIKQIGFQGMEHMASGRFYVWSHTIPMLKKYGLFGCGADHFYLSYPQNDYLGKAQYCSTPLTIIEKPHNTYLLIAVQNGIPALFMLLGLYILYFRETLKIYRGKSYYTSQEWINIGVFLFSVAYMVGYMFVDSSVNITPVFWMLIGMGSRRNES